MLCLQTKKLKGYRRPTKAQKLGSFRRRFPFKEQNLYNKKNLEYECLILSNEWLIIKRHFWKVTCVRTNILKTNLSHSFSTKMIHTYVRTYIYIYRQNEQTIRNYLAQANCSCLSELFNEQLKLKTRKKNSYVLVVSLLLYYSLM